MHTTEAVRGREAAVRTDPERKRPSVVVLSRRKCSSRRNLTFILLRSNFSWNLISLNPLRYTMKALGGQHEKYLSSRVAGHRPLSTPRDENSRGETLCL
jgi:hypothetical protein